MELANRSLKQLFLCAQGLKGKKYILQTEKWETK